MTPHGRLITPRSRRPKVLRPCVNLITLAIPCLRYLIGVMESWVDGIVTITSAVVLAAYVAISLGYVALYDLGLSGEKVRGTAMVAVILIAATVAVDFFGKKQRKAD